MSTSADGDAFARPAGELRLTQAAQWLAQARAAGARHVGLPPALAPSTEADAYAMQRATAHALAAHVAGWKATMADADTGTSAPVLATDLIPSPAKFSSAITQRFGIEPEIAFSLGEDLPPLPHGRRYQRADLARCIAGVHAAIEIVISRFESHEGAPPLDRLADNLSNGALIVASARSDWHSLDLATLALRMTVTASDGTRSLHEGRGGHPLSDPLLPLLWLANHCSSRSLTLEAGQIVTTGSCAGMRYVGPGARVEVSFEGLGTVELSLI